MMPPITMPISTCTRPTPTSRPMCCSSDACARSQSTIVARSVSVSEGMWSAIHAGSESRELARMSAMRASSAAGLAPSERRNAARPKPAATSTPITSVATRPTLSMRARARPPFWNGRCGAMACTSSCTSNPAEERADQAEVEAEPQADEHRGDGDAACLSFGERRSDGQGAIIP